MSFGISDTQTASDSKSVEKLVRVDLGMRSYDIRIGPGLIEDAGRHISAMRPGAKCAIVTDENVASYHLDTLRKTLEKHNLPTEVIILPPGEATKSFRQLERLSEKLLELGIERNDLVIAFGGGVIGDLVGFSASILRRGVSYVQIPTSLLAQVDSSVGGKTGINTPQGKNLVGTFHQPILVIADTEVLDTLPKRQFRAGYAEVVKYGLINDPGFFTWLESNFDTIAASGGDERIYAIEKSCKAKAAIVAEDEREAGKRALLNLGHTFGHALEAWAGYSDRLLHGEAIAIGMSLVFEFSERLELCRPDLSNRVKSHFRSVGLPTQIQEIPGGDGPTLESLMTLISQDKKVVGGVPAFILVKDIGGAFVCRDVSQDSLRMFLQEKL